MTSLPLALRWRGALVAAIIAATATVLSAAPAAAQPGAGCLGRSVPGGPNTTFGYYLFESNGAVMACGGAPLHGSLAGHHLPGPVIDGTMTPDGGGYWIVNARGGVNHFGDAQFFGSTVHRHLPAPVTAFAPTPDGGGYWIVTAKGNMFHFGDARFFGSTVHRRERGNVVSIVPTLDGQGYWIVISDGTVANFGDAPAIPSLTHRRPLVISARADPDGAGLYLLTADGGVHNQGASAFYGSLVHQRLRRPVSAMSPSPDGSGYVLANAAGSVYNFGDAQFVGSLAAKPPRRPVGVVAIEAVVLASSPTGVVVGQAAVQGSVLPRGAFGYDISNYQCASPGSSSASSSLPPTASFAVIEAVGWLDSAVNPCLGAEVAWARQATSGDNYSLYMFVNAPDQTAAANALDATGPAGTCATLAPATQASCLAYNYGYGGALAAIAAARSAGAASQLWWLDVEGTNLSSTQWSNFSAGQYWSSQTALNDLTIQGAIDAVRSTGAVVGIYSTSVQFPTIAGSFVPSGAQIPIWVAGAPWTNPPYAQAGLPAPVVLAPWCAGTAGYSPQHPSDVFAGGVPWLLQETPGTEPSPYNLDPNYTC